MSSQSAAAPRLQEMPLVVVSVGTDFHQFERLVEWATKWAMENSSVRVVIQRGTVPAPVGVESHELIEHQALRALFAAATAVVSHGGPSTVMDARMAGRLPIVVPRDNRLGEHVDDHQLRFARHLERHSLARLATTYDQFCALIDEALANPDAFTIDTDSQGTTRGVIRFGQVVDELLGTVTPLATGVTPPSGESRRRR